MATDTRSRGVRALTGLAGAIAALIVVAGVLVAVLAASLPMHVTHTVAVPDLQEVGDRVDRQLVPTGRTEQLPRTDTCIPLRQVVHVGGSREPALCHDRDEARLAIARGGLVVAAGGVVLMLLLVAAGAVGDRVTRREPRRRSSPAHR